MHCKQCLDVDLAVAVDVSRTTLNTDDAEEACRGRQEMSWVLSSDRLTADRSYVFEPAPKANTSEHCNSDTIAEHRQDNSGDNNVRDNDHRKQIARTARPG